MLLLAVLPGLAPIVAAQSPTDTAEHHENSRTQVWGSVALGAGNSDYGGLAGRAAASLAVNSVVMFTVSSTTTGGFERTANSTNILAGVKTPDANQFLFLSAGWAGTTCGNACTGESGIAAEGGAHMGGKYVGVSLVGFAVHASRRTNATAVVVAFDFGLFGR